MDEDKLSTEEIKAFKALKRTASPPPELGKKIVNQLKFEGFIKEGAFTKVRRLVVVVAASILFFLGGMSLERYSHRDIDPDQGYMLVLFEDKNFNVDEPQKIVSEYMDWHKSIEENGVHIVGQELHNKSAVVNKNSVIYLDSMSTKRVTGYFILEASSVSDVVQIASTSPHVKYGGSIEIKEFRIR